MHQCSSIGRAVTNLIDHSLGVFLWCNWENEVAWVHSTLDTIGINLHELNLRITLWVLLIKIFVRNFKGSRERLVVGLLSRVKSSTIWLLTQGARIVNNEALLTLSLSWPFYCEDVSQNCLGSNVNWEWTENLFEDNLMESSPCAHTNIVDNNSYVKSLGSCKNQFLELLGIFWCSQVWKVVLNDQCLHFVLVHDILCNFIQLGLSSANHNNI